VDGTPYSYISSNISFFLQSKNLYKLFVSVIVRTPSPSVIARRGEAPTKQSQKLVSFPFIPSEAEGNVPIGNPKTNHPLPLRGEGTGEGGYKTPNSELTKL